MESTLLAAGALGLSGADALSALGGLAAGGVGVDHFGGVLKIWNDVRCRKKFGVRLKDIRLKGFEGFQESQRRVL